MIENKYKSKYFYRALFSLSILLFLQIGCKRLEHPSDNVSEKAEASKNESIIQQKNIRRNGSMEINIDDINSGKVSVKEYVSEFNAQLLEENITVNSDSRTIAYYRIKIKAQYFSELVNKLSNLGELINVNITAEDVSDELTINIDAIELLRERLNQAKKSKKAKLIDSLQKELNNALKDKDNLKKTILYSYLNVRLYESTKVWHALELGYSYGKEGFIYIAKAILIIVISMIPIVLLYLSFRIFLAFVKWRWLQFIAKISRAKTK